MKARRFRSSIGMNCVILIVLKPFPPSPVRRQLRLAPGTAIWSFNGVHERSVPEFHNYVRESRKLQHGENGTVGD